MHADSHHSAASSLSPGDKLDKYDVLEQIAAGGMSIVWKGYDRLLGQAVAIKQIATDLPDSGDDLDAFRERFRKEAAIHRKVSVDQKHLVRVLDFIDDERGMFIVMEFVDGPSLEQILQQLDEPMEMKQALGIIGATAKALRAIHDQGVLHRDLKPSNILLPRDGGLKVCDFGLATLMADQDAMSLGSVRYMAPESFGSGEVDRRADIYSLGMIAYELLAGRPAFEQAFRLVLRDQRNQALRWMKWHTNTRAKAPALHELNGKIDRSLSELVGRMMEKDPAARIESASQALKAIKRHVTGETEASAERAASRAKKKAEAAVEAVVNEATAPLPKASRMPWIVGGIAAFWLVVGVVAIMLMGGDSGQRARLAEAQQAFDRAYGHLSEGEYARAHAGFELLASEWPEHPQFGRDSLAFGQYAKAHQHLAQEEYDQAIDVLTQLRTTPVSEHIRESWLDRIRSDLDNAVAANAFHREMQTIRDMVEARQYDQARIRLADQRRLTHTEARLAIIRELGELIEDQATRSRVDEVLARAEQLVESNQRAQAMQVLQDAQEQYSDHRLREQLQMLALEDQYQDILRSARAALAADRYDQAVRHLEAAMELRASPELERELNQARSDGAFALGQRLLRQGDAEGATEAFTRAMGYPGVDSSAARRALAQIETTTLAIGFVRAGDAATESGDYDQAITQYENALDIAEDADVRAKLREARARNLVNQGRRLLDKRELAAARQAFIDARTLVPTLDGAARGLADVEQWSQYLNHLQRGDTARQRSQFGDAIRAYRQAQDVIETDEIEERLTGALYDQFVARARSFMDAADWTSARASLQQAALLRDTQEVRQMFARLNELDPSRQ